MSIVIDQEELVLRSVAAQWDYARWQRLPDDGNRYEVIDGVLYTTTAPSYYHQWVYTSNRSLTVSSS